jgi:chromosome partitioning protein
MSAPVVSFINMKGGVGKTTLCVGIGEYLANELEKKVLLIDIDPQFNASQSLLQKYDRIDEYLEDHLINTKTIRKIFETKTSLTGIGKVNTANPVDIIVKLSKNLDMIFGDINIIFDTEQPVVRLKKLKKFIEENNLKDSYDYILIDSPPTISLFTDAALVASDFYLVPVKIDHYSILGANSLLSVIDNMQVYTNTIEPPAVKTKNIQNIFESTPPFSELYFFKSKLGFLQSLMVGGKGNIASSYAKSRREIHSLCLEFMSRINDLQAENDEQ